MLSFDYEISVGKNVVLAGYLAGWTSLYCDLKVLMLAC